MPAAKRRRVIYALFAGLLVLWAIGLVALTAVDDRDSESVANGAAVTGERQGPFRGGSLPRGIGGAPAPQFVLDDARGGRLDTASLTGRPYLVTFLYTDCPDVCPLIAQEIKLAFEQLGPRAREVTALAVTADPKADTPHAVRSWLKQRRMPDNFRYLLGSRSELEPVWKAHFAAPQEHDKEESAHSASIWLVDRKGRWRTKFSGGLPVAPADIAHDLRLLLDEPA